MGEIVKGRDIDALCHCGHRWGAHSSSLGHICLTHDERRKRCGCQGFGNPSTDVAVCKTCGHHWDAHSGDNLECEYAQGCNCVKFLSEALA